MSDCPCERMGSPLRPVPFRVSLRQHSLPMQANTSDKTKIRNLAKSSIWNELANSGDLPPTDANRFARLPAGRTFPNWLILAHQRVFAHPISPRGRCRFPKFPGAAASATWHAPCEGTSPCGVSRVPLTTTSASRGTSPGGWSGTIRDPPAQPEGTGLGRLWSHWSSRIQTQHSSSSAISSPGQGEHLRPGTPPEASSPSHRAGYVALSPGTGSSP
jgi:hypothetical protein